MKSTLCSGNLPPGVLDSPKKAILLAIFIKTIFMIFYELMLDMPGSLVCKCLINEENNDHHTYAVHVCMLSFQVYVR